MVLLIVINVVLIGLGLLCLILAGSRTAKSVNPKEYCYKCGYDLRGTIDSSQQCPEYGMTHEKGQEEYDMDQKAIKDDSKTGCVLIIAAFVIDAVVITLVFILAWFYFYV